MGMGRRGNLMMRRSFEHVGEHLRGIENTARE